MYHTDTPLISLYVASRESDFFIFKQYNRFSEGLSKPFIAALIFLLYLTIFITIQV